MSYNQLKTLLLSDGRTLAYDENGDTASDVLVIFFHGVMGVGSAKNISSTLKAYNAHFLAPTLPGWGDSSPRPKKVAYNTNLVQSMSELINHLKPNQANLRIYISGGSYGTLPAQMLYGASFDVFPLGRRIKACMIVSPLSPFLYHKGYTKAMTWTSYFGVGPAALWLPFIPSLAGWFIQHKLSDIDSTEKFLHAILFSKAKEDEKAKFDAWRKREGKGPNEFEREMAINAMASFKNGKAGFVEVASVAHSDWGFDPSKLDREHTEGRPLHIVAATEDDLGHDMPNWLEQAYPNTHLEWIEGGHISAVPDFDRLWRELLEVGEGKIV